MTDNRGQIKQTEIIGREEDCNPPQLTDEGVKNLSIRIDTPCVIDGDWLGARSEDDLLDLIVMASCELRRKKKRTTEKITRAGDPISFREYSEIDPTDFITVPVGAAGVEAKTWYIVLVSFDEAHPPLALKLVDDVVFGRAAEDVIPDIDLTGYDAEKHGISREHAKIRVTTDQLQLADLGSTNGTYYYDERVVLGKTAVIADQSVISFGKLHFKVVIVRRPGE